MCVWCMGVLTEGKRVELDSHLSEVRDGSIQFQKDLLEEELAAKEATLIHWGIQIAKRAG